MSFSANYLAEAAKDSFSANYYIVVDGMTNKYSKQAVSGLTTKALLTSAKVTLPSVTLDKPSTALGSLDVKLIDPDDDFLADISVNEIHEKKIEFYIGFTNLASTDYKRIARYVVRSVSSSDGNTYNIKATEAIDDLRVRIEQPTTFITADITNISDPILVNDSSVLDAASAQVKIEDEIITYAAKATSPDDINTLNRGASSSTAEDHKEGAIVYQYREYEVNPITMLLRLLVSPGGGGAYDVLDFGAGISQSEIDISAIESVRDDTKLSTDTWRFHFDEPIDDLLAFMEDQILFWTNTRIFTNLDGKIEIVPIGQVSVGGSEGTITKGDVIGGKPPSWIMSSQRLINSVPVEYDFNTGTGEFESQEDREDSTSITKYGTRRGKEFQSDFIKSDLDGADIIEDRMQSYFEVNAAPKPQLIATEVLYNKQFFDIGSDVTVNNEDVPDPETGTRGIDKVFEVLSRQIDPDKATVRYNLHTNRFLNIRAGWVGPAADFTGTPAAGVFDVDSTRTKYYKSGYVVSLWPKTGGPALDTQTIDTVVGDTITLVSPFSVTPVVGTHVLKYATYSNTIEEQKQFASFSDGTTDFPDGNRPYQIQP